MASRSWTIRLSLAFQLAGCGWLVGSCSRNDEIKEKDCKDVCDALGKCKYLPSPLGKNTDSCETLCETSAASFDEDPSIDRLRKCILQHLPESAVDPNDPGECALIAECAAPPLSLEVVGRGTLQLFGWNSDAPHGCLPDKVTTDVISDLCGVEGVGVVSVRAVARSYKGRPEIYNCKATREQGVFVSDMPAGPGRLLFGLSRSVKSDAGTDESVQECASLAHDVYAEAGKCVAASISDPSLDWTSCENDAIACHDGLDNDDDGAKDCADSDCLQFECKPALQQADASVPQPQSAISP